MEQRLIDANELKRHLIDKVGFYPVMVARAIKDAPTVDAEPVKHGKWSDAETECGYVCSVCGTSCLYELDLGMVFYRKSTYCPNCGAKLDGKDGE